MVIYPELCPGSSVRTILVSPEPTEPFKVVEKYADKFNVVGLSAYGNTRLLESQIHQFKPKFVALNDKGRNYFAKRLARSKVKFFSRTCINKLIRYRRNRNDANGKNYNK